MGICANDINIDLDGVIMHYINLNRKLHLDIDDHSKYEFENQDDLINTLVLCRDAIVDTLKLYIHIMENEVLSDDYEHTRDLYKRSKIRVTHAIIYHDLKNVFEILDIAASDKSSTITLYNISEEDLDNVYAAMLSFMLQTMKAYDLKLGLQEGKRHYGQRKISSAVSP